MMIKKTLSLLLLIFSIFFTNKNVNAMPAKPEQIDKFDVEIIVNKDGTIQVTEIIDYYFSEPRHGIIREIPLSKENIDEKKYLMSVESIYVNEPPFSDIEFKNNSTFDWIKLQVGNPNLLITGPKTYRIFYMLSGALTYFSDHDELYWNVTGNDWDIPINETNVVVTLPEELNVDISSNCFTGALDSSNSDCETYTDGNSVYFKAKRLNPGEGLTITTFFPNGVVEVLEPVEDTISSRRITIFAIIISIFYLLLPVYLIIKTISKLRKSDEERRVVAAWFDPPKDRKGNELTASEVGILHDKKGDIRDFTAGIVQLAQKGFLKIEEISPKGVFKKADYKLSLIKLPDETLKQHERDILEILFTKKKFSFEKLKALVTKKDKTGLETIGPEDFVENEPDNEILVSEISKNTSIGGQISKFYSDISSNFVREGIFSEDPIKTRNNWIAATVIATMFFNPLLIIAFFLISRSAQRTKLGGEAYAVVESMNNFVKSQNKQLEFQAKNQMMFEKLLPYAIALGVEKIWVERFKDIELADSNWYSSSTGYNNLALANFASSFSTTVSTNVSISSSRSSSGFSSGGGGFSGGGGGGGGGGSW